MRAAIAGVFGGVAAGVAVSLAMSLGRRASVLHKTLVEHAEDWGSRRRHALPHRSKWNLDVGAGQPHRSIRGVRIRPRSVRECGPALPAWLLGAIYGSGLYVNNIVGMAPLIQLTEGEQNVPAPVRAERFGLHLLYGIVTGIVTDRLAEA